MRLGEHPDFRALVSRVASEEKLPEWWIEKDYYLTEILRVANALFPSQAVLKGGTSLSKGFPIIQRISEDIDLFFDPSAFDSPLGKHAIDRHLKQLCEGVRAVPGLSEVADSTDKIGGFARIQTYRYEKLFPAVTSPEPTIILEAGIQSGREPQEHRTISSYVGRSLSKSGRDAIADDVVGFEMPVMHFSRTFVEKLFTIHGKVARFREDGTRLGRSARHYADLFRLQEHEEVRSMLTRTDYETMRRDYDATARKFYPKTYRPPEDLRFRNSPAIFPDQDLEKELAKDYRDDVPGLFLGDAPRFDQILDSFRRLRELI